MVLKIFICPSHIANWNLGLLESIGHDRHPIRALGSFHYQKYLHMINKCHSIWKWATRKTRFRHNSCTGVYGKYLQVKSRKIKRWSIYWGMHPSIGNTRAPVKIRDIIRLLCRLKHWSLHHSGKARARDVNRNKRNGYKLLILVVIEWSMYKERILRWGNWSILCTG